MDLGISGDLSSSFADLQTDLGEPITVGSVVSVGLLAQLDADGFDYSLGGEYDNKSSSVYVSKSVFSISPAIGTVIVWRGESMRVDKVKESFTFWQLDMKQVTS